ncbi:TPA: hypothetical protein ACY37W_002382 [Pasteurella multocida]
MLTADRDDYSYRPKNPTSPPKEVIFNSYSMSGYFLPIINLFQIFKERGRTFIQALRKGLSKDSDYSLKP